LIILDENILDGQRLLLQAWRLAAKQIGLDLGRKGLKDGRLSFCYVGSAIPRFSRAMQVLSADPPASKLLPRCGVCWPK
jgi:hypothetical protein